MSIKRHIAPTGMAPPPEPYVHVVEAGETVHIAGQVAFNEQNEVVGNTPYEQALQVWSNIRSCLEGVGLSMQHLVRVTIYLADIRHAPDEIAARLEVVDEDHLPVVTMVQVANLGLPELLMEIDATAHRDRQILPSDSEGSRHG